MGMVACMLIVRRMVLSARWRMSVIINCNCSRLMLVAMMFLKVVLRVIHVLIVRYF